MTFQCPPSPSGTFQPERSRPVKSAVKPGGGSLSAARAAVERLRTSKAAVAWRPNDRTQTLIMRVNLAESSIAMPLSTWVRDLTGFNPIVAQGEEPSKEVPGSSCHGRPSATVLIRFILETAWCRLLVGKVT